MRHYSKFYVDGDWVDPIGAATCEVINPATEQAFATIRLGNAADVDRAVAAAREAFDSYSRTSREERLELLERIVACYQRRIQDMADAIRQEMGAPASLARNAQAPSGLRHLQTALDLLRTFEFECGWDHTRVLKEPIGVCGLITPWNWPVNQIACKVAPALATGCTMVLKPSEVAPISAILFAEILHEAGVPRGVFNLVLGDGPGVGTAMSSHPGIDMMSFTGSTRGGISVAKNAADTVKRVSQELGGKSANIILEDADLESAVTRGVLHMLNNSGQSCNAPSRMLVPRRRHDQALGIAARVAASVVVGDPSSAATTMGPVVNKSQFDRIQKLIQQGIDEGATLATGGPGRPNGLEYGYYVRPTVFGNVSNDMSIAREEIFGPVLAIIPYDSEEDAIRIANDTVYGLSGYVQGEASHAAAVARRIRAGMVHINGAPLDNRAPFGGYKQSGNGREWGAWGFDEFLEVKAVTGYPG